MTRSRIDKEILANGPAFIESIAASNEMRDKYGKRPEASRGHVKNAILFGILTANERYEAAEAALSYVRLVIPFEHIFRVDYMARALKNNGIIFYNDKAAAIIDFMMRFELNPTPFHPMPNESCAEYRDRLLTLKIRGLGFVKTSFAAYLAYGGGNVICADRHILNIYTSGHFEDWMHKSTARARDLLYEVEAEFIYIAGRYQWPSASALQWAVWCEAIGSDTDHDPVSEGEPDATN